jgi:hypothetical protein
MDDVAYDVLAELQLPRVHLISLTDFERNDLPLLKAKQNRSVVEYYFTCTPTLPLHIFNNFPEVDIITYLDADLYFFSSIEPVFEEMGSGSILIIGHRFSPSLKTREIFGIYNVGLLSFRHDKTGLECLHWWRDRCLEWCFDRTENGKFADQKYLDDWPDRFAGVVVLQHKGAGLAPWNIENYEYSSEKGGLRIDGQPIIMYHFHGLKQVTSYIYDTNISAYATNLSKILRTRLYFPYISDLKQSEQELNKIQIYNIQPIRTIKMNAPIITRYFGFGPEKKLYHLISYLVYPFIFLRKIISGDFILSNN